MGISPVAQKSWVIGEGSGLPNLNVLFLVEDRDGFMWAGTNRGISRLSLDGEVVPYQARRLPLGLGAMAVAGLVSGLAGVGGGFVKTPAMREPITLAARFTRPRETTIAP